MRQQGGDHLALLDAAGFWLKHQAHGGLFARFISHHIQHRQQGLLELDLVRAECLFAGFNLGVGQLFNFFEHLLCTDTRR